MIKLMKSLMCLITACAALLLPRIAATVAASTPAIPIKASPEDQTVVGLAPWVVTIWFDQSLVDKRSQMRVLNAKGTPVDEDNSRVDPSDGNQMALIVSLPELLPDGAYTVTWHAVTPGDGLQTEGNTVFVVDKSVSEARPISPVTSSHAVNPIKANPANQSVIKQAPASVQVWFDKELVGELGTP